MYRIVAPFPFLSSVPGWIVLEAVPSTNTCVDMLEIRVRLIIIRIGVASNKQTTDLLPRLVAFLPQTLNLIDGTLNVVNSGGGSIKDVCTALLNGCGDLLKAGDGVEVAHGRIVSGLGAGVKKLVNFF